MAKFAGIRVAAGILLANLIACGPGWAQTPPVPVASGTPAPVAPGTVPPADASKAQSQPAQSQPAKLTGMAALAAIEGNTITAKSAGEGFSDFLDRSGTVKHVDQNGLSTGSWAAQDGKICLDFPDEDERSCFVVEVTGSSGTATAEDGSVIPFGIQPGNSLGL